MHLTTKIFKTLQVVFGFCLVYFAIRLVLYHYHLIVFPYSDMLREGAIMSTTQALLKGLNPYAMSLQPQYTNEYGIVYSLLVWPWAKIFGLTLTVHRIVTAASILGCCAVVFCVIRRMGVPFLLNLWAVLLLYASFLYPATSTPCVDPAATGILLLLLTIFIPWFCRYSYSSLIISVLFGILAFYTKQYTMLGIIIMGSYLFLFVSRQKAVFYGFLWFILGVVSVFAVNRLFPAYFDECFFAPSNMGPVWASMEHLYTQIHMYKDLHQWILLLTALFVIWQIAAAWRAGTIKQSLKSLWVDDIKLVIFACGWACFVLYISLGRHTGSTLWYFLQLLSPFLLITVVWVISRQAFWPLLAVPFLLLTLYTMSIGEDYKVFNADTTDWSELTKVISQHEHILNSALIVPMLIQQNKEFFDNGQSEYFLYGASRSFTFHGLLKEDDGAYYQQFLFFERIRDMVENKAFDLIVLQPSLLPMGVADDIRKYYKFEGGFSLMCPQDSRPYDMTIWVPL